MTGQPPLLDWRDRSHWGKAEAPCRHCHLPTQLRDDERLPAHKVCAEQALSTEHNQALNNYARDRN